MPVPIDYGSLTTIINGQSYPISQSFYQFLLSMYNSIGGNLGVIPITAGGTNANTAIGARTQLGLTIGQQVEAWSQNLDSLAAYNTAGILTQTAANTFVGRTITGSSSLAVTHGDGVLGNPTLSSLQSTTVINVKSDFSAKGDGSTDDTLAIQAAINSISSTGGTVYFPTGTYVIGSTLTITNNFIILKGAGKASILQGKTSSISILKIGGAVASVFRAGVKDLQFQTGSVAIEISYNCGQCYIDNVYATGFAIALDNHGDYTTTPIHDNTGTVVTNFEAENCSLAGIRCYHCGDFYLDTFRTPSAGSSSIGFLIDSGASAVYAKSINCVSANYGIVIRDSIGISPNPSSLPTKPHQLWFSQCLGDTNKNCGWNIQQCFQAVFVDCWGSGAQTNDGWAIGDGSTGVEEVSFIGCRAIGNATNGFRLLTGNTKVYASFSNCHAISNSTSSSGTYDGFRVETGVQHFSIVGCKSYSTTDMGLNNYQKYGINIISGSSDYYNISNNITNPNLTAGISDNGSGTNKLITNDSGTITSGTWNGSILTGTYGGTGINNGTSTITVGGNVTYAGSYTYTANLTGTTNITFPTSGTLLSTTNGVQLSGSTMTGALILNADPITALGAATKQYVDTAVSGLTVKNSVRLATTSALTATYNNGSSGVGATLTNLAALSAFALDGVSANVNDRVLIKNQASSFQNGVYSVTTVGSGLVAWVLTRTTDFNQSSNIVEGAYILIEEGTTLAATGWVETGSGPFTVGTTAITFTQFNSVADITAGTGIVKSGTTVSIDTAWPGQTAITTLGTITTGTWHGGVVIGTYGGTGVNNGSSTITIGGNVTYSGAFTFTGTLTNNTSVTYPTSGTLTTTTGTGATGTWSISISGNAATVTTNANLTGDITSSGNVTSYSNTVPLAKGGTNVTSVTTTPTATAFAGWDANKNLSANNHIEGYTTTATAASTTTLTVASTYIQRLTGSTTQTVALPVVSGLVLGQQYLIQNRSTGVVTIQSSGLNTIYALPANSDCLVTCILTTGTTAASWDYSYGVAQGVLPALLGGTGVSNGSNIQVGGTLITANQFTTSGNFALTLTSTATTNATLPAGTTTLVPTSTDINSSGIVTKTNNVAFATSATTDTTNAGNISSGLLAVARGGTGVAASDPVIQRVSNNITAVATGTTTMNDSDSIPQNTEGTQFLSQAITPKNSSNILVIEVQLYCSYSVASTCEIALFQDSTANALAAAQFDIISTNGRQCVHFRHTMTAGTTSATTFKIRAGGSTTGTITVNGAGGTRRFGGTAASSITVTEYST